MSFIETRFPDDIAIGAVGGPGFNTDVVSVNSGSDQRKANWQDAKCAYDVSHGIKTQTQLDVLVAFFRVMKGRANAFRFKDWADYKDKMNAASPTAGIFATIDSTHFQMVKRYTTSVTNHDRDITKPVSGSVAVVGGVSPSVDYTTGIVTVASGTPSSWTGEFDVPCRFDTDQMKISIAHYNAFSWGGIPIVETRPE